HRALKTASALDSGDRYASRLAGLASRELDSREAHLASLARTGKKAFTTLFGSANRDVRNLRRALAQPDGRVEIARCRGDAPLLPWQLIYDLPIATTGPKPRLCSLYRDQIASGADLLDDPARCSAQPGCAHRESLVRPPTTGRAPLPSTV